MFENENMFCPWMFAPEQLLCNRCEEWPSNKGDLDKSVMGDIGREYYMGVDVLLSSFLYCGTVFCNQCALTGFQVCCEF
jgi:hypothetical protein